MFSLPFQQIPECLPALATYLQNQASLLQSVKNDLDATKKQLQQAIGKFELMLPPYPVRISLFRL